MYKLFIIILTSILILSCDDNVSSKKNDPITKGVENVILEDVNNNGNGSDLRVKFSGVSDESQVVEYRIMIRAQNDDVFTVDHAELITESNYTVVTVNEANYSITLEQNTKDINGQLIQNDIDYNAYIFTEVKKSYRDTNFLSGASNTITLNSKAGLTSNIFADDIKNDQNPSDIEISFDKAEDEALVKEYRVYIIEKVNSHLLEAPDLILNNEEIKFRAIEKNDENIQFYLTHSDVDINNNPIKVAVDYYVVVGTIADGVEANKSVLNTQFAEFNIQINNYIETFVEQIASSAGGMTMHPNGNLYLSDIGANLSSFDGNNIHIIDENANVTLWKTSMDGPIGSSFDENGNFYIVNYSGNNVMRIAEDGTTQTYGLSRPSVDKPMDVYYDSSNEMIYVTNSDDNIILQIGQDLESSLFYDNTDNILNRPNGITKDNQGNFYISNFNDGRIIKIDSTGIASVFAQLNTLSLGQIIFANDALYVVARDSHRIYQVDLNGTVKILAGTGNPGSRNGSAIKSDLNFPFALAISNDNKYLYFNVVVKQVISQSLQPSMIKRIVLDEVVNQ